MILSELILEENINSQSQLRRVTILPDESWWGGAIHDGYLMPFNSSYKCDLRLDIKGNQASPFLLSDRGRFIWSDDPFAVAFVDREDRLEIELTGERFALEEGFGDLAGAFQAASSRHFPASGRMPDPLNFLAPQYNTWIEMEYNPTQEKVLKYAAEILANGLPPGVLMIDDGWFVDHGNWCFDPVRFPDPRSMTRWLHAEGFAVVLWVSPFISPDSGIFRDLSSRDQLVRRSDGNPAIRSWWNGYSALLDVSHPGAIAFLQGQLSHLKEEFGIDGFKFDAGDPEYIKPTDLTFESLSPVGYCQAWAEIGLSYPHFNELRACWKMGGQPLIQRLRDKHHVWGKEGLADIIPNGIAQGLAGYSFICPDMVGGGNIASFTDPAFRLDQELFVRTLQCSVLFPVLQFSIAPWRVLDEEHWLFCRTAIEIRERLASTILDLVASSATTGEPILRPMSYVFPDSGLAGINDQFMLGENILVAPVCTKGARSRKVSFPVGNWVGDDGEVIVGPCLRDVEAPISRLPWYQIAQGGK
jgi:alpha-glucosidase (family GH31 glycosyl hydrolase)